MYAIIESGGKQFRAEPGKTLKLPSLKAQAGETVTFDDVLLADTDGQVRVGTPKLEGVVVVGEVLGHFKDRKVVVFKWKRRKNYRRKQGHRQKYTQVRIDEIRTG